MRKGPNSEISDLRLEIVRPGCGEAGLVEAADNRQADGTHGAAKNSEPSSTKQNRLSPWVARPIRDRRTTDESGSAAGTRA